MADIIQLLPDSIANQIAAGEVIQRPASVVKELMENAIDAGALQIQLIIKDSGKTSIQVIDNGKGMSETDARMAFERHATSKIRTANDLFSIRTMGFRGEALASIAAIAHVELITRQVENEVAHRLVIEGSHISKQEKIQAPVGTSISVKNLFYNVPARRKFLKSDPVELRHILDEFHRVALAHPEISFSFHHNGNETYRLNSGPLKQRIIGILGKHYIDKLIPINEESEVANFTGYVTKPDAAKKTQGDQYIFVNNRFIKSHYLSHAIRNAYEDLLTKEMYPAYFLFLDIDPAQIDINVHPTKTEIKFDDERLLYNYLRVTVKHSLGQYALSPMLDFDTNSNLLEGQFVKNENQNDPQANNYSSQGGFSFRPDRQQIKGWEELYRGMNEINATDASMALQHPKSQDIEDEFYLISSHENTLTTQSENRVPIQLNKSYVVFPVKSGMMLIDQQAAHERILYEQYLDIFSEGQASIQKELFPRSVDLDRAESEIFNVILPTVNKLGFEIEPFGQTTYIIHGTPAGLDEKIKIDQLIHQLIEQYLAHKEVELGIEDNLARSMATSACIKRGRMLNKEEMDKIADMLFACKLPYSSPSGKKCFIIIEHDYIQKRFS